MAETIKAHKVPGGYINKYGVFMSEAEIHDLQRNVDNINRRRVRQLKKLGPIERTLSGAGTGNTVAQTMRMGYEPELAYRKRSAKLSRFRTRESFEHALRETSRALQPGYIQQRMSDYRENYITGLRHQFGDSADELINALKEMPINEFMNRQTAAGSDDLNIKMIYETDANAKNQSLSELAENWQLEKVSKSYADKISTEIAVTEYANRK
jgi:hypothetical protein